VSPPVVNPDLDVAVAARGGGVAMATAIRGLGAEWYRGAQTSRGWVAALGSDGSLDWSRTWGAAHATATEPTGVTIDALGSVWVSAFRRDAADRGYDVAIRRYTETGDLDGKTAIDAPRFLMSAGIAAAPGGAYAAGSQTDRYAVFGRTGHLWRLAV
jgi:hypothetical protein